MLPRTWWITWFPSDRQRRCAEDHKAIWCFFLVSCFCEKAEANIQPRLVSQAEGGSDEHLTVFSSSPCRLHQALSVKPRGTRNHMQSCRMMPHKDTRCWKAWESFLLHPCGAVNWHCNQNPSCFTGGATAGPVMAMMPHVTGVPSNFFYMLKTMFRNDKLVPEAIRERERLVWLKP